MKIKTFLIGLFCCMAISSGYVWGNSINNNKWVSIEKRSLIPEKNDVIEIRPYKDLVNACIVIYDSTGALVYSETVAVSAGDTYCVNIGWLFEGTYLFVLTDGENSMSITLNR